MRLALIEKTAEALAARLEECGDGSQDNQTETVRRALDYLLDTLEEDLLTGWEECFIRDARMDLPWRLDKALEWARSHGPDAGP